ncbi:DNA-formamidopyrimidine glycosylase family protein [Actinokineospora xionganensis]|uniref:DNA-(apurinic or apyrimidinic site) lyase n=1 Tax=Actinokineospora xionganensis TaxID=2684470 RepID=A0ABR7L4Q9_9PSEU|nr:DNA-formamidopyrimidine glycosylase family protein [Actinokineospora xionganensis]MBC6447670.1 DNA glycosylase [Actinokineospora xionganensis]
MPEGDTVYQAAARLAAALTDRVLTTGELRHPRLSTVDLKGRTVLGPHTVGKHLFLRFDRDLSLHSHLGLDGTWQVQPRGVRWRRPAHQARAVFTTAEHQAVGFLLHEMALVSTGEEGRLVAHLGPDLLDPTWGDEHAAEALARLTAGPEREIGLALLDQRVMAGIGNVFKAEICHLLGVSPWTPVSDVDSERAIALSRDLLERNKMTPDRCTTGDPRRDRRLWVYGRTRSGCLRCGSRVVAGTQGSGVRERVAYFCPKCQPGPTG